MDTQQHTTKAPTESVILLHGLARTRFAMRKIATALSDEFHIVNQGYPSRSHPIETLADLAIAPALEACANASRVHFVTHSLGGILVRQYLSQHSVPQLGHVVMLGPPNKGSEIVEVFRRTPVLTQFFDLLNGPAGRQLGTNNQSRPRALGAVDFSLGVIAGNRSVDPVLSRLLPSQSDGKVTVESSRVEGMQDHIVLPVDHTFMMRDPKVITQIRSYLRHGRFDHHD